MMIFGITWLIEMTTTMNKIKKVGFQGSVEFPDDSDIKENAMAMVMLEDALKDLFDTFAKNGFIEEVYWSWKGDNCV